jgi:hypothetical protein
VFVGCQTAEKPAWVQLISPFRITSNGISLVTYENKLFHFDSGIWLYDFDTQENICIVPKENADDFCVVNGYVYYFDPAADTKTQANRALKRVSIAGGTEEIVWNTSLFEGEFEMDVEDLSGLYALGDCVAFHDSGATSIAYSPTDNVAFRVGDEADKASKATVVGDQLYFIEHRGFRILQKPLHGTAQAQPLFKNQNEQDPSQEDRFLIDDVITVNGELYYSMRNPCMVFRYRENAKLETVMVFGVKMKGRLVLVESDGKLYYSPTEGLLKTQLFCYDPLTNKTSKIFSRADFGQYYTVIHNRLFYWKSTGAGDFSNPDDFVSVQLL